MTPLTPEEQILETITLAIEEELNPLINEINQERGENWLPPTSNRNTEINIHKVKRSIDETYFTKEDYTLIIEISFKDSKTRTLGYRYNFALTQMIKRSETIPKVSDFVLITDMLYHQNPKGDEREKSQAEFIILIRRSGY